MSITRDEFLQRAAREDARPPEASPPDEVERYELREPPRYRFKVSRRTFLQSVGAGLVVVTYAPRVFGQDGGESDEALAGRFLIGKDGVITAYTSKVEVGQGSRTQISQAVAEEFRVPIARVNLVQADTALVPDDGGTFGSRTTPSTIPTVRAAAAAAREALIEAACDEWGVSPEGARLEDGVIRHSSSKEMPLSELAEKAAALDSGRTRRTDLAGPAEWKVMGEATPKIGMDNVVTGRLEYPSDIKRPNMVYGAVARAPRLGASLTEADEKAVNDQDVVVVREGDFLGCTAPTRFAARRAAEALSKAAIWDGGGGPDSDSLFTYLKEHTQEGSGRYRSRDDADGDVDAALENAARVVRAEYHVPYIQHAPMEPRAAAAEWDGDKLTVWTATQRPFGVRGELSDAFGIPEEAQVRVIVPESGGGFGGKHSGECAIEAARLAKAAGKPVNLQWTREEEFTWAYHRPAGVLEIAAAIDSDDKVTGWDYTNYNSGGSGIACPYTFANKRTRFQACDSPLRQGSYRALASTANSFAREAFMDRLAKEVGAEPLAFRQQYLEQGRLRDVLEACAEEYGWNEKSSGGNVGHGIACGTEKGSYVATCAQVTVDSDAKRYTIDRLCVAYECGAVQNPLNLRAQVIGAVIQGLGAIRTEEARFKDGVMLTTNFKEYEVPRFKDVPPIALVILNRTDLPSVGAGETPIIGVAPAVANAIYAATGTPVERLPIRIG